jgi:hypothetical protein
MAQQYWSAVLLPLFVSYCAAVSPPGILERHHISLPEGLQDALQDHGSGDGVERRPIVLRAPWLPPSVVQALDTWAQGDVVPLADEVMSNVYEQSGWVESRVEVEKREVVGPFFCVGSSRSLSSFF